MNFFIKSVKSEVESDHLVFHHRVKVDNKLNRLDFHDLTFISEEWHLEIMRKSLMFTLLIYEHVYVTNIDPQVLIDSFDIDNCEINSECFRYIKEDYKFKSTLINELTAIVDAVFYLNHEKMIKISLLIRSSSILSNEWVPLESIESSTDNFNITYKFLIECVKRARNRNYWWLGIACIFGHLTHRENYCARWLYYDDILWYGIQNPYKLEEEYVYMLINDGSLEQSKSDVLFVPFERKTCMIFSDVPSNINITKSLVEELHDIYGYNLTQISDQNNIWINSRSMEIYYSPQQKVENGIIDEIEFMISDNEFLINENE
jgi:hypothetical protein